MTIKELKRKGYKLSSQNGLALMFWRHGIAAKGERSIHEVYKLAQDGESLDSMISEWYATSALVDLGIPCTYDEAWTTKRECKAHGL